MKVDGSLRSLLQGVSQQPARDRLPGQCTDMVNMTADPVSGLSRRPPSDFLNTLFANDSVRFWYDFDTKDGNSFVMAITGNGGFGIWDLNGNQKSVTVVAPAASYLNTGGVYSATIVNDQITLANSTIIPAMGTATKAFANHGTGSKPMAMIQILGGQYGKTYSITQNGNIIAQYRTPNGTNGTADDPQAHAPFIRTTHIAQRLKESMTIGPSAPINDEGGAANGAIQYFYGNLSDPAQWSVVQFEDILLIVREGSTDGFTIGVNDDQGNVNVKAMTDTVQDVSDLPRIAPNNYVVRQARETDPEEDIWFEFIVENGGGIGTGYGQTGYWQETVKPGLQYQLNLASMPVVVDYNPNTVAFTLRQGNWMDRRVGTDITNPEPSFIGNPIRDVSSFQSRLVFLSGPNVIMSRTKRYNDFWIGSADTLVESDPIDISSTSVQATIFQSVVPHNKDLVVFSKKGQFVIFGRNAITPMNAALVLTTAFEAELRAKPVATGRNVFFGTNYGDYTGIREFYTEGSTDINDTRPITDHVKKYIRGRIIDMAATSNHNHLVCTADANLNTLYVYQYIWSESGEKIQSAWSTWGYNTAVIYSFFRESTLYTIQRQGNEHYLYRQQLDIQPEDGFDFPIYMDAKFDVFGVNTTFEVPGNQYAFHRDQLTFIQGPGCPNPGMPVRVQSFTNPRTVVLEKSMNGGRIIGGLIYRSQYIPTMPFSKDADGVVQVSASLKPREFDVTLGHTGYASAYKRSKYTGIGTTVDFEGRRLGYDNNLIGVPPIVEEEIWRVPFREETKIADLVIYTTKVYPMTLLDIEYQGQYTKRGRRMSQGGQG